MALLSSLLGIGFLLLIAIALSEARRSISPRIVLGGLALQIIIAYGCLRFAPVVAVFDAFARGVTKVISFADKGTEFLFGNLADAGSPWGFIFAVKVLPIIIFFAALMGVLYHLGIMQRVVAGVAWVLRRWLGVTGAEALSSAANVFVGQTEAPLVIKPYIAGLTRSQLMAVMTGGFATIAGSVMAAYVGLLGGESDESRALFAKHLITASVMSAPAGFVMAKIMIPERETPAVEVLSALKQEERTTVNIVDAAACGASDGLRLAANVAAMLVAFVALIAMIDWPLAALSEQRHIAGWRAQNELPVATLANICAYLFYPIAWAIGVPSADRLAFAALLGKQVIATEFVAYLDLAKHVKEGTMSPRACQIATYALCGFANLPSIAIQIGGLSALAPSRRADLARLAPRAMVAGALACWMTATVAAMFIP
jgi:concentrative nucleoside transporter, CNT family